MVHYFVGSDFMSKKPKSDQDMAQATFAAILAAQKGDDALAGEILRSMAENMMGRYGTLKKES